MPKKKGSVVLPLDKEEIIKDYRLAYQSRQASPTSPLRAPFAKGIGALDITAINCF